MTLCYIGYLEHRFAEHPPSRKGLRTRALLRIAAAKVLREKGYHGLRITDVTRAAETAEGSFYLYFKDKTDITLGVLTGMLDDFFAMHMANTGAPTPAEAVRNANRQWIGLCRQNAGLMRCVFQLADEEPRFAHLLHHSNRQWYGRIAQSFARQHEEGVGGGTALFAAYLLGSMMDEIVRKLIAYPDPEFLAVLADIKADDLAVADGASLMWLKILYEVPPRLDDLPPAAADLASWMNHKGSGKTAKPGQAEPEPVRRMRSAGPRAGVRRGRPA